jgi:TRAP-type mannitol/chloroaromatic compound transport system permease small subunit
MADIRIDLEKVDEVVTHAAAAVHYPRTAVSDVLEGVVGFVGRLFSWIWVPLMVLVAGNVVLRYIFGTNIIALEELQWHLYAVGFMVGLSYCVLHDGHVRVDVLAELWRPRTRGWIEVAGLVLFLLPFCYFVLSYAWPFVERSYLINEVSAAPNGLPMRWVIKSVILIAFVLLAMAAVARLLRTLSMLTGFPPPRAAGDEAKPVERP